MTTAAKVPGNRADINSISTRTKYHLYSLWHLDDNDQSIRINHIAEAVRHTVYMMDIIVHFGDTDSNSIAGYIQTVCGLYQLVKEYHLYIVQMQCQKMAHSIENGIVL